MAKLQKKKPRGRPAIGDQVMTFRLDLDLYKRIEAFAEKEQRPLSNAVRLLLEVGLENKAKK